jgi:hypothetical protein
MSAVTSELSVKMAVFWDVAPCSLVETDRHFRDAYCLYHQGYRNIQENSQLHTRRREKLKSQNCPRSMTFTWGGGGGGTRPLCGGGLFQGHSSSRNRCRHVRYPFFFPVLKKIEICRQIKITPQYQISWKSFQVFLSCYVRTDKHRGGKR